MSLGTLMRSMFTGIREETTFSELTRRWKHCKANGHDPGDIIEWLAGEHPAVVAVLIVQGAQSKDLDLSDCNTIANLLLDHRKALFDEPRDGANWLLKTAANGVRTFARLLNRNENNRLIADFLVGSANEMDHRAIKADNIID